MAETVCFAVKMATEVSHEIVIGYVKDLSCNDAQQIDLLTKTLPRWRNSSVLEAKRLNRMISPHHLIAYCQANAAIQAAVGQMSVRGFAGVPVLAEIKADNIAGLMPRRAIVITTSRAG